MMEFRIRRCGPGDERALSALGRATFLETYAGTAEANDILAYMETEHSVEHYQHWLAGDSAQIWVVETAIGSSAIGYLVALDLDDAGLSAQMEIKRIYLLYRFHRNGIGNLLMNEILATAREKRVTALILKVQEINQNAIAFYFQYGFRIVGGEPLRAGERDYKVLVMKLDLSKVP
jgi:ribosomal protein S18 acetylase RimI-like enzyme